MNQNFFLSTLHFSTALAILESQINDVVKHILAENIPLLSERLVYILLHVFFGKYHGSIGFDT